MADYARAQLLRQLREARHLSQEHLAFELGVTAKTIRTWEKGGRIRWENAKTLGRYFDRDPETLVSREEDDATPDLVASLNGDGEREQLDRIEAKLDQMRALVTTLFIPALIEQAQQRARQAEGREETVAHATGRPRPAPRRAS